LSYGTVLHLLSIISKQTIRTNVSEKFLFLFKLYIPLKDTLEKSIRLSGRIV